MSDHNDKRNPKTPQDQQRRTFVKSSVVLGAGALAAGALPAAAAATQPEPTAKPGQKGYQLTQHVIDYYKSASV